MTVASYRKGQASAKWPSWKCVKLPFLELTSLNLAGSQSLCSTPFVLEKLNKLKLFLLE